MVNVLVYGATGTVGFGLVKHFLSIGATVIGPIRKPNDVDKLKEKLSELYSEKFFTPVVNYLDEPDVLAKWITENITGGKVDHIVVSGGSVVPWVVASAIDESILNDALKLKIVSLAKAAKYLLPILKDETTSTFTIITGGAGEKSFTPAMGLLSTVNAAQFGFTQGLISETERNNYRINEYRIKAVIRFDDEESNPNFAGYPASPTSALAKFFARKIVDDNNAKGTIVHVIPSDLA